MKILLDARMVVAKDFGMGRYLYNLLKELANIDQENDYVIMVNDDYLADLLKPAKNFRLLKVGLKWLGLMEQFRLPGIIKKVQPDIFHAGSFVVPLVQPCPTIATIYDLIHVRYPKRYFWLHSIYYNLVLRKALMTVKRIITISEFSKNDLVAFYKLPKELIRVAYPAVEEAFCQIKDRALVDSFRQQRGLPERFILYVGNRKKHKNLLCLLTAYSKLATGRQLDHKLVLSGPEDNETKAFLKRYNIEGGVIFAGMVRDSDLALLYNAADLFVFPSLFEGFGLPPLEAMACG
ncbi:MAG: glycosyltransferase family 4 protein, partial [Candidatus Margulisbacteria bacterium]|nr:glycosyltransferase family 4 protein [Candidatus Margulisiibacteriota bacterium]